ncbi:MAG: 4-alpha-glucanotransferase [Planctomycetales bacterium]|nr:4-alpha-glucanotransferase [Planctomycetales bacterium]
MPSFERSAGILLHITSLPGEFGLGDLGQQAYQFADFLERSGQRIWQLLPIGPTIQCDSPYSCYSAFAGNPLLISPRSMVNDGFLPASALDSLPACSASAKQADYACASRTRWALLETAYKQFREQAGCGRVDEYESFCTKQRWWLDDYALFAALMRHFKSDQWTKWPEELVSRDASALGYWRERLSFQVEFEQFIQFVFFAQWHKLKDYANRRGIKLFGDMPIFVAHGSADVWANQGLFCLHPSGESKLVAGVPPDYFSTTGQLWGNPLYNWDVLRSTDYRWWTQRFQMAFDLYDILRIDHFRAFEAYWEIPAGAKTAVGGRWVKGPGTAPFDAARRKLGDLNIVAEDLGLITDEVHALREQLKFPGMRVLQFGFDAAHDTFHRPDCFPEDSAAYTGTHDNSTIVGWLNSRKDRESDLLSAYLQPPQQSGLSFNWQLISMVLRSQSTLAIVPLQDVLGLDDQARMNVPGQATGNWLWRFEDHDLTPEIADRLRLITVASDR